MSDILLIDLSSILHPIWHMETSNPNPNATSDGTVARVRALASGQPHVAICIDSRTSFRKAIDPTYKAQRESNAPLQHQMRLAIETLKADGFPVWGAEGFEADDVIAAAVTQALIVAAPKNIGHIVIATADKDLAQLVGYPADGSNDCSNTVLKSLKDGSIIDREGVKAKFGVNPEQVLDYLSLVGDASDNVKGCPGIGPKWAAGILAEFGSLELLWKMFDAGATPTITASKRTALQEFRANVWPTTRELIKLKTDVPIPFEEIFQPRVAAGDDVAIFAEDIQWDEHDPSKTEWHGIVAFSANGATIPNLTMDEESVRQANEMMNRPSEKEVAEVREAATSLFTPAEAKAEIDAAMPGAQGYTNGGVVVTSGKLNAAMTPETVVNEVVATAKPKETQAIARVVRQDNMNVDYERQLEPRSLVQAYDLAKSLFQARLFSAYGNPDAVLSTILAGREFGMPALSSLRAFHIISGRPCMSADMMRALVLKSGFAEYFRCSHRSAESATFVTKRKGDPEETSLTVTTEEGRTSFSGDDKAWKASGWSKHPADMCVARASSKLARLVYADILAAVYSPEEFDER